jgi:hypothetical protein
LAFRKSIALQAVISGDLLDFEILGSSSVVARSVEDLGDCDAPLGVALVVLVVLVAGQQLKKTEEARGRG